MSPRLLLPAALLAFVVPDAAFGHANPLSSSPENGAVLARAPADATVTFDDAVRVGPHNAAIRNDGLDVLGGAPHVVRAVTLVLPLRRHLGSGDYTVRWSVVSNDGHEQEGVLAFAVGSGRTPPVPALGATGYVTWQRVLIRALFYLGALGAGGIAFFVLAVLRPLELERLLLRPQANLLFAAFLLAFVGADALIHVSRAGGTRFERFVDVALGAAVVGGIAAALAPRIPRLRYLAWLSAGVLLVCPTFAGHALDPGQPAVLAPLADLLHVAAAAIWLGGLASLALIVRHAPADGRRRAARRFSGLLLATVPVLAISGVGRAVTELDSVGQLWSTGYGRALLTKTGLLVVVLALAWWNRHLLASGLSRLGPTVLAELALLTGVAVAVATLTDLPPGRKPAAARAAPERLPGDPVLARAGYSLPRRAVSPPACAAAARSACSR